MKKTTGLVLVIMFALGIALYVPCWAEGGSGGGSGGSSMGTDNGSAGGATGGSSIDRSTGGATGGAAGEDLSAVKKEMNGRLDKVNKEIDTAKKNMKNMPADQKDKMQLEMDRVTARKDAVKKMIGDMKSVNDRPQVETALTELEQSAQKLSAGTQRSTPAGDDSWSSGVKDDKSSGGGTGGSSMDKSAGGATGGAAGEDLKTVKKDFNTRLDKVNKEIDDAKKSMKNMPADQKDKMQLEIDRVTGQRDAVKKMVGSLKSAQDKGMVESELMELEQSAKKLSASMQRSKPAGESQSGGATGGSSMDMNQSTGGVTGGAAMDQGIGGATGGAVMSFSYDQKDQFKKTARTKYDGLQRRIDMLRTNAKNSPDNVNKAVMPKIDELRKMSDDVKGRIDKIDQSAREEWDKTKAGIDESLTKLEQGVMETEKTFR
ncbi:MAG: sll1863 family stress response protein [Endomicrobiales bacterium]